MENYCYFFSRASPNVAGVNTNGGSADTPDDKHLYEFGLTGNTNQL